MAYVCADPGVPVFGTKGASIHVREVVRALARKRVSVDLFAVDLEGEPTEELMGVRIHAFAEHPQGPFKRRESASLAANDNLREALEQQGPFDLVYERYSLWSYAGMEWARAQRVPGLLEANAPLIAEQAAHRELHDRVGAEDSARRAFRAATALVAVSRAVAAYLEGFPEARGKIHVVPNGVDPRRFPPNLAPTRPGPEGSFTIGFLGSLKPWHGLPVLVESFAVLHAHHPESRLLVVGDGPERGSLESDLAARGLLGAVAFVGSVPHKAVPGLLASMDVSVAPYSGRPDFYFSPLKVFESMAAGRPIVASRIGQIAEVIRDGEDGLLVPPGDPTAIAAAIERLRANPDLRTRLGAAARARILEHHTWDAVADRVLTIATAETVAKEVTA